MSRVHHDRGRGVGGRWRDYLDLTALGRQDSQDGNPQAWIRDHMEVLQQSPQDLRR